MIQPSIHKRDIESNRMCGALFDMRDLAQMLAHVRDAAMESAKFRRRQRSEGRPRSRPPAIDCTDRYVSLTGRRPERIADALGGPLGIGREGHTRRCTHGRILSCPRDIKLVRSDGSQSRVRFRLGRL
jgi:hypothetical protein